MKRLKKGIFPLIIGVHILLRLVFSDTLTNDEIITKTSNIMPNEHIVKKSDNFNTISLKKSEIASLESN